MDSHLPSGMTHVLLVLQICVFGYKLRLHKTLLGAPLATVAVAGPAAPGTCGRDVRGNRGPSNSASRTLRVLSTNQPDTLAAFVAIDQRCQREVRGCQIAHW